MYRIAQSPIGQICLLTEVFLHYSQFFIKGNFVIGGVECTACPVYDLRVTFIPFVPCLYRHILLMWSLTLSGEVCTELHSLLLVRFVYSHESYDHSVLGDLNGTK